MYQHGEEKVRIGIDSPVNTGREPEVTSQVNLQEKLTQELLEYVSKLEERLVGVLRLHEPVNPVEPSKKLTLVPMANRLNENNERIMAATARVNYILSRLEL